MRVTLVKVVGEVSNNNHTTEFFRVYKLADLILDPILKSYVILYNGTTFQIQKIEQDLEHQAVLLYDFEWCLYREHWGNSDDFDKIKLKMLEEGWQETKPFL